MSTAVVSAEQKKRSRNVGLTFVVLGIVAGAIFTNRPGDAGFQAAR